MKKILMMAMLSTSVLGATSFATPIKHGIGITSPARTITFSEIALANDTALSNQYASLGLKSISGLYYEGCPGCVNTPPAGKHPNLANFTKSNTTGFTSVSDFKFSANQTAASFEFASNGGSFTLTSLLNGIIVDTFKFDGSNASWGIYGFTNSLFDELQLNTPSAVILDNIELSNTSNVPEPMSIGLMGIALAGMAFTRTRKNG